MAELADAQDLGSCGQPCGFDPHYPYHVGASVASLAPVFYACAPTRRVHHRQTHPVGARMARPSPVPATIGARDISNLVPGGYKIRPYGADGGRCGRRTAPNPGAGGPMWASAPTRRNHQTPAEVGSRSGRPYRPPLREDRRRVRRGGLYIRPGAPTCWMHHRSFGRPL